jgi:hypothetical protein
MKYTRFEFKDINTGILRKAVVCFLILVSLIASLSGLMITKIINLPFIPKIQNALKVDSPVYRSLKERRYYVVQMGAFSNAGYAESLYEGLKASGIPGQVVHKGQYYIVSSFADSNKERVDIKTEEYKQKKYAYLVKVLDIIPVQLTDKLKSDSVWVLLSAIVYDTGELIDNSMAAVSRDGPNMKDFKKFIYLQLNGLVYDMEQLNSMEKGVEFSEEDLKIVTPINEALEEVKNLDDGKDNSLEAEEIIIKLVWSYSNLVEWYNEKTSDKSVN